MIRLKTLLEQVAFVQQSTPAQAAPAAQSTANTTQDDPAVSGITIMQNKLTSQNNTTVNVDGVLSVVNCESATGTYVVGTTKYDIALVQDALGTDTTIRVYAFNEGDTAMTVVADSQPLTNLQIRFEFPKTKIPNLTADTTFYVMAMQAGKPIKYNNQVLRVKCEGFMLV